MQFVGKKRRINMQCEYSNFWELFPESEEYPDNLAERGAPQDTLYEYVSNTFLDGLVNYVEVFAIYVLAPGYGVLSEYEEDIKEALNETHTKFHEFGLIDTVLLAETGNSLWVFWYNADVSDCTIGRCDIEKVTKSEFETLFLCMLEEDKHRYKKLDRLPRGWKGW